MRRGVSPPRFGPPWKIGFPSHRLPMLRNRLGFGANTAWIQARARRFSSRSPWEKIPLLMDERRGVKCARSIPAGAGRIAGVEDRARAELRRVGFVQRHHGESGAGILLGPAGGDDGDFGAEHLVVRAGGIDRDADDTFEIKGLSK